MERTKFNTDVSSSSSSSQPPHSHITLHYSGVQITVFCPIITHRHNFKQILAVLISTPWGKSGWTR